MLGAALIAHLITGDAAAQALSWSFVPGPVLAPSPAISYMGSTVSSPSVAYDSNRGRLLMMFETRTNTVDPNCPNGVWAIGQATSPDGITWTPRGVPALLPVPGSGTYYQCVAAHPTMLYDPVVSGPSVGGALVWFKAEQGTVACPGPAWGCDDVTGVGRVRIFYAAAGNPISQSVSAAPVWASNGEAIGFPKMTKTGSTFRLLLQVYPDIWSAESTNPNVFSPSVTLTVAEMEAAIPGARDELINPSSICGDDAQFPDAMFVGARDKRFGVVQEGHWSKAMLDPIGGGWMLDTATQQTWADDSQWRHWDVHKLNTGADEYVVWFDEKDPVTGDNTIRFGGTDLSITGADLVSKKCP